MSKGRPKSLYPREELLRSKRLAQYQPDFLRAILCKESYTMQEAERAITNYFEGGNANGERKLDDAE